MPFADSSRRAFLQTAAALSAGAIGYRALAQSYPQALSATRYGPLQRDPANILDLPRGFSYRVISRAGEPLGGGLRVPARPDGMAAFPAIDNPDQCLIVRNHEISGSSQEDGGAFASADLHGIPVDRIYDRDANGNVYGGGTTTMLYDLKQQRVLRETLSLCGTSNNCAGGPTPWGSWLSCEETEIGPDQGAHKPHGFVFEVPAAATGPVDPLPLTGMGRFKHEAVAIDPATGIAYLTEDQGDGLIYRFIPDRPGDLHRAGRLQALAVRGAPTFDTRNWPSERGGAGTSVTLEATLDIVWIDLEDIIAREADLRLRGAASGAAIFARGEGMACSLGPKGPEIYFACTSGGRQRLGQVWRYRPSAAEGTCAEATEPGQLVLVYESASAIDLDRCDNLVAARDGFLVICEDGDDDQFLRLLERDGRMGAFARNAMEQRSEFCGACFSPDGATLFVNVQVPGLTLAITGPWA